MLLLLSLACLLLEHSVRVVPRGLLLRQRPLLQYVAAASIASTGPAGMLTHRVCASMHSLRPRHLQLELQLGVVRQYANTCAL